MMILIIEDNAVTVEALQVLLELEGHQVEHVQNGRAAVACLGGPVPDVVLLDFYLPDVDGLAFLQEMRQRPGWALVPVILNTAAASADLQPLLEKTEGLGPLQVLRKPFEPATLLRLLQDVEGLKGGST
jgi:CheY-like chemotaxis protein